MHRKQNQRTTALLRDSRLPAVAALMAIGGIYYALPERLAAGPSWMLFVIVTVLTIIAIITNRTGRSRLNVFVGMALSSVVTLALMWSFGMLVAGLPQKRESSTELLRAAVALWLCNILVFASWYWRLDAGGVQHRENREYHTEGDFLFPQMMLPPALASQFKSWKPQFVDYLFLAFNTSTAFSPTDVPILSRWAKAFMMIQSTISLGILVILAARAINLF